MELIHQVNTIIHDAERTLLHSAVIDSHVERVKILLKEGADVNALDSRRYTPLHYAVEMSHVETVKILLAHGANVNAVNCWRNTPLHSTVDNAKNTLDLDIVKLLLEYGADANIICRSRNTALLAALCNIENVKFLEDLGRPAQRDPTLQEIRVSIVALLLENGANVNISSWSSPLHIAVSKSRVDIVELLLEHGADVDILDDDHQTPLHRTLSEYYRDISVLKTLLRYGANVRQDEDVFYIALSNTTTNSYEVVKLLLENGATPDFDERNNILLYINQSDHYHLAELLIQFIALNIAANRGIFQVLIQFRSVLLVYYAEHSDSYKHFFKIARLCYRELLKMRCEVIHNEQTLFQFVYENCSRSTPHDLSLAQNSIDALLLLLHNGEYVVCRELIYAAVKRSVVVDRLCELLICYHVADNDTITLNHDCVNTLAEYLSKDDLINIIIVFNEYECPNTRNSKRRTKEVNKNVTKKLRKL